MTMTSAGTTLGISLPLPATRDDAGYAALTYTNVGQIESIGEYGKTYNEVTFTALDDRMVNKFKGSYDPGSLSLSVARTPSDPGQAELLDALDTDDDVAFRVVLQDGTTQYVLGKVLSYTTNVSSVDSITMATVNISLTSDIVEVAADATPAA